MEEILFAAGGLVVGALLGYLVGRPRYARRYTCGACETGIGWVFSGFPVKSVGLSWNISVCKKCLLEASTSSSGLPLAMERIALGAKAERDIAAQVHAEMHPRKSTPGMALLASPTTNTKEA